jgi:hypothetical protein
MIQQFLANFVKTRGAANNETASENRYTLVSGHKGGCIIKSIMYNPVEARPTLQTAWFPAEVTIAAESLENNELHIVATKRVAEHADLVEGFSGSVHLPAGYDLILIVGYAPSHRGVCWISYIEQSMAENKK